MKDKIISTAALVGSTGTLLCCVLPAVVALAAGGAAVGSLVSVFPWLIPLSQYKFWVFLVAGFLIVLAGILVYRPNSKLACTIAGGHGCEVTGHFSKVVFWVSIGIYTIGSIMSFLLVPLLRISQ